MNKEKITRSSGNIYKDLDFGDAEKMQAKASLVSQLLTIIENKKWTQQKAAEMLGIPQSKISLLSRGQFSGFSLEKLITLLNKLNQDVEIVIKRNPFLAHHMGHVSVSYASA